ncbi:addiction module protein [Desulfosudis oleivorans]|nr:addiction module protein [Desulfosudis oleivorans]
MHFIIPLEKMSIEDKLQAIEVIWADLASTPENIPSPSWHADVLRAREKRISEGASSFLDITEAKKAVRDLLK